ncbi:hypothetical protein C1924_10725 [Stenotrophomonas sp. ESTM1D_MKCIP4_1]|nr:hypothetical protein C1924_10725 [Stenotrophomonas sp. ESTM1D_MKCIP4_1]
MHTLQAHEDAALLHRFELSGAGSLRVERWRGREALSEGLDYHIDVRAGHADPACEAWLGRPATLSTRDAQGRDIRRTGLVREVILLDCDQGFARYRIRRAAWTWWLGQRRNSRVFRDATVRQIVDAVSLTIRRSPAGTGPTMRGRVWTRCRRASTACSIASRIWRLSPACWPKRALVGVSRPMRRHPRCIESCCSSTARLCHRTPFRHVMVRYASTAATQPSRKTACCIWPGACGWARAA